MNIRIQAKSSGDKPYDVDFFVKDNMFSATCNCQAGMFGKLCKHKTELLAGDSSRLFDESEIDKLDDLSSMVNRVSEITRIAGEISESEKIIKVEQSKLKKIKKRFETNLKQGVALNPS